MAETSAVVRGWEALSRRNWREAYARLCAADREAPLAPDDLERLATAALLVGEEAHATAIWTRAHGDLIERGDVERAAERGFRLSLHMLLSGNVAQATGWLARSRRLLKDRQEACVASGYGLIVAGLLEMGGGGTDSAATTFEQAVALAERFGDADLLALALLGLGQSLIRSRHVASGVGRLDEAMVSVTAGEVSTVVAGIVYCAVILTCQGIFDLRRAREWTRQLDAWCAAQPDLVPYRGQCRVHRSEILQADGDWRGALAEVMEARDHLRDRSEAVVGRACYQQGELHRLRGEVAQADEMYREAARHGVEPQPGISLLLLAEGRLEAAAAAIGGVAGTIGGGPPRPALLAAQVEILIATGDLDGARRRADELTRIATDLDAPILLATSTRATGAVLLAQGKTRAALALLREAWALWQQIETPYETARTRTLLAQACDRLGDRETARIHFGAARAAFAQLGAAPELRALKRRMAAGDARGRGVLTAREREVLALVASGETNRQIAATLGISAHTVARHLSNIFDKLGVSSRTAASACAHQRGLV